MAREPRPTDSVCDEHTPDYARDGRPLAPTTAPCVVCGKPSAIVLPPVSDEDAYLEMTDPVTGKVVAHTRADRIVFVRAEHFEVLMALPGATREAEGVSFEYGDPALAAALAIKAKAEGQ